MGTVDLSINFMRPISNSDVLLEASILRLGKTLLRDPVRIEVTPPSTTVERIEQSVHFVEKSDKRELLCRILADRSIERTLVFVRTKIATTKLAERLEEARKVHQISPRERGHNTDSGGRSAEGHPVVD